MKNFFEIISFMKPYSGMFTKHDKTSLTTYYNEREWRYVPNIEDGDFPLFFFNEESFDKKKQWNRMEKYKLAFTPDDIKYLIVQDETEVLNLVKKIESIKGKKYLYNSIKCLTSRILTSVKIKEDF